MESRPVLVRLVLQGLRHRELSVFLSISYVMRVSLKFDYNLNSIYQNEF